MLAVRPEKQDHILVYVTSGYESLLQELARFGREQFRVYGYDRDQQDGVLQFKPFSRDGFVHDLATAKAVISTAGFTLISEALSLRKPYLALPMQGQFEQQLNGYQLRKLGYGTSVDEVTSMVIGDFLYRLPDFECACRNMPPATTARSKQSSMNCWPMTPRCASIMRLDNSRSSGQAV